MVAQQPGQHLLVNPAFGARSVTRSLHPPGALPRRGNLPSPAPAHAEALGQLDQAALALVVGLQKLLPQITRIGSRHRHVRGESPSLLYTIGRNALSSRPADRETTVRMPDLPSSLAWTPTGGLPPGPAACSLRARWDHQSQAFPDAESREGA